ncbi:MAG TPA: hypothetical protein PK954_24785 [Anaerolineales bacterium]|nr:hypothetical protein [Anaerolineales bacterium]
MLGAIEIGADSRIGANAVVVRPVPPNSVVVGVPGQVVVRTQRQTNVDLNHTNLPDTLGTAVAQLLERVEELEHKIAVQHAYGATHQVHAPLGGVWRGDDFQI